MMFIEKKCAITPRQEWRENRGDFGTGGTERIGLGQRLEAMVRSASEVLNMSATQPIEVWRGLRPCTPDGVPILGRPHGFDNLVIAAGHQMLGLLTAPASGTLVADLVTRCKPSFDPAPFCANRF